MPCTNLNHEVMMQYHNWDIHIILTLDIPEEVGHASSVYDVKLHNQALFYMLRLI